MNDNEMKEEKPKGDEYIVSPCLRQIVKISKNILMKEDILQ